MLQMVSDVPNWQKSPKQPNSWQQVPKYREDIRDWKLEVGEGKTGKKTAERFIFHQKQQKGTM